ncbi:uncharacterized protein SPPG_03891 [Spizellomyces punctatus DAOM BR117]|uniref:EamA domain-containing protein n=1 Tax=Spizellomyces punctatus (strain DAOM BR117) TaxID=645134 RepID=A0A0L0HI70_SPIPD|nr:uncharacterized protein SPPG_03891 [Spizellomyces punctatus DAOM BR117]KND00778.1 hypothetical protein SPPG_03891 [Spizellomyces punctatus DAOM BR117]|eukprot:XP_016608817.1 hypothetical protein SPPG_03891 [Spizellomyces punctatus DAOM BR117]
MPTADWTLILCILGGGGLALQAGMNGTLGTLSRTKLFASCWSFGSGCLPLLIYFLATMRGVEISRAYHDAPLYAHFGGIMGTIYVVTIVYLAPRLGAASLLSTAIASQMTTALLLDHFAWLGLERREASVGRVVGVLLTIFGVVVMMGGLEWVRRVLRSDQRPKSDEEHQQQDMVMGDSTKPDPIVNEPTTTTTTTTTKTQPKKPDWTLLFSILAGTSLGLQAAMNAQLGHYSTPAYSALFSFSEGFILLLLLFLYDVTMGPTSRLDPPWTLNIVTTVPYWAWLGGFLGAAYVLIVTIATPRLGAVTVLGTSVCAQVIAAVLCDHFGIVGLPVQKAGWERCVGAVVVVGGVVLITVL